MNNLVLFSRYLFRVEKVRIIFEKENKKKKNNTSVEIVFVYHALLYVCIEAYRQYQFNDKVLNFLLGNDYQNQIDVLRKMRNSIFHPDKEVFGERQKQYLSASDKIINWSHVVLFEFNRFVYLFAEDNGVKELGVKVRKTIKEILGWLPEYGILIKHYKSIKKIKSIYSYMIRDNPSKKEDLLMECQESLINIDNTIMVLYKELIIDEERIL